MLFHPTKVSLKVFQLHIKSNGRSVKFSVTRSQTLSYLLEFTLLYWFSLFLGWQEVHQACRNGLVAHLEQLLYYGAELNARNASGNTPLHVCAVNNQESCARTLLFRGADKNALNFAGQTPYQVRTLFSSESKYMGSSYKSVSIVPRKHKY